MWPDDDDGATPAGPRPFDVSPDSAWSDAALDAANATWVREAMAIVEPDLLPGRYINELSDAGPEVTQLVPTATPSSTACATSSAPGIRRTSSA